MREILFKAKRMDNGEWVQGDLVRSFEEETMHAFIWARREGEILGIREHEVNPETVCQYTGLADKNGVKIFEWDKYRYKADDGFVEEGFIDFCKDESCFMVNAYGCKPDTFGIAYAEEIEITGNIHDNA